MIPGLRAHYLLPSVFCLLFDWLGPGGTSLPFRTSEEVAGFLREAKVVEVSKKSLPGTTKPRKVVVENGGVRANTVFRSFHKVYYNTKWDTGKFTKFLRDSYRNEIAAYELSLLLGLDTVPPTVPWRLGGREGALQLWIENAEPGYHAKEARQPADVARWLNERAKMRAFDALIENVDRNVGNMLIDSAGKVWWIDHTRAFGRRRDLEDAELVTRCERGLFERLKTADPKVIAERMQAHMTQLEIDALLERRLKLIALIEQRIAANGQSAVLFTLEPLTATTDSRR